MSPLRDSTRARDLDRTNARWLLDAAYEEGQLGAGEYHDRIAQAASSATLRDLRALTSDLQLPTSVVSTHPVGHRSTRARLVAATAITGVVLVTGVVAVTVGRGGSDTEAPGPPAAALADPGSGAHADAPPHDLTTPIDPFTAAGIDAVVARYRFQFGDTVAASLVLYPDGVRVTRAAAGAPGRVDVLELAERFEPTGTEPIPPRASPLDLTQVDAVGVERLIADAPALVGAEAGHVEHILVADSVRPTVTVYVADGGRAAGYVVADLAGAGPQVIRTK